MVCPRKTVFWIVIVNLLCLTCVDGKRRRKDRNTDLLQNHKHIGVDIEINDAKVPKLAKKDVAECPDCDNPKDSAHKNLNRWESKKGKESEVNRRKKKKLKKNHSSSNTQSVSLTDHFSSFWKDKPVETEKDTKNGSVQDILKKKKDDKSKIALAKNSSSKKLTTHDNSLLNFYANYWNGSTAETKSRSSVSKINHHIVSEKERTPKNKGKQPSREELTKSVKPNNKNKSLLHHFSSFWDDDDLEIEMDKSSKIKKTDIGNKKKEFSKNSKKNSKTLKLQSTSNSGSLQNFTHDKTLKIEKTDKSNKHSGKEESSKEENMKNKNSKLNSASASDFSQSKNDGKSKTEKIDLQSKNKEKKRKGLKKTNNSNEKNSQDSSSQSSDMYDSDGDQNFVKSGPEGSEDSRPTETVDTDSKSFTKSHANSKKKENSDKKAKKIKGKKKKKRKNKKDRKQQAKSKSQNIEDKTSDLNESDDIESNDKTSRLSIDKIVSNGTKKRKHVESKSATVVIVKNERKQKKNPNLNKMPSPKDSKSDSEDANIGNIEKGNNAIKGTDSSEKPDVPVRKSNNGEREKGHSKSTVVDFQDLKGEVNSIENSNENAQNKTKSDELRQQAKEDDNRTPIKGRDEISVSIKSDETDGVNLKGTDQSKTIPTAGIRKNEKNNSIKENFYEMLANAEMSFKSKDRRIRRRLAVLKDKTKKRFDDFISKQKSAFDDGSLKVTLNLTHPNQQLKKPNISLTDLKNKMLRLKDETVKENRYEKMMRDETYNMTPITLSSSQKKELYYNMSHKDGTKQQNMKTQKEWKKFAPNVNQATKKNMTRLKVTVKSKSSQKSMIREKQIVSDGEKSKQLARKKNHDIKGLKIKRKKSKKSKLRAKQERQIIGALKTSGSQKSGRSEGIRKGDKEKKDNVIVSRKRLKKLRNKLKKRKRNKKIMEKTRIEKSDSIVRSVERKETKKGKKVKHKNGSHKKHVKHKIASHKKRVKHKRGSHKKRVKHKNSSHKKRHNSRGNLLTSQMSQQSLTPTENDKSDQSEIKDLMMKDDSKALRQKVRKKNKSHKKRNQRKRKSKKKQKKYNKIDFNIQSDYPIESHRDDAYSRNQGSFSHRKLSSNAKSYSQREIKKRKLRPMRTRSRPNVGDNSRIYSRSPSRSKFYNGKKLGSNFKFSTRTAMDRFSRKKRMRTHFRKNKSLRKKSPKRTIKHRKQKAMSSSGVIGRHRKSKHRSDEQEGLRDEDYSLSKKNSKHRGRNDKNHNDDPDSGRHSQRDEYSFIVKCSDLKTCMLVKENGAQDIKRGRNSRGNLRRDDRYEDGHYFDNEDDYPNTKPYPRRYSERNNHQNARRVGNRPEVMVNVIIDYLNCADLDDIRPGCHRRRSYGRGGPPRLRLDRGRRHKSGSHSRHYNEAKDWDTEGDGVKESHRNREDYDKDRGRTSQINYGRGSANNEDRIPDRSDWRIKESAVDPGGFGHDHRSNPYPVYGRNKKRLSLYEYQRQQQLQRLAPVVNQKCQRIKQHLQGVLLHYSDGLSKIESIYKDIFNWTRCDIMNGLRDVYEDLHSANEDIYDAVMGASHTTRTIYMKAHQERDALIKGLTNDDPPVDLKKALSMITDRNFRQTLRKARMENRTLNSLSQHVKMFNMRHMQVQARFQQVRDHLNDRYDHQAILNLFNNMRSTIDNINEGLAAMYGLTPLRRHKSYIILVKSEIDGAKSVIKSARSAVQNGMRKLMENNDLYRKWERENRGRRKRVKRDRTGIRNDIQSRQLKQLTTKGKWHSLKLKETADFIQRTLQRPIYNAKTRLQQKGKTATTITMRHLNPFITDLMDFVMKMISTLDILRIYVDNQPNMNTHKICKEIIEGSGMDGEMDNDDENSECIEGDIGEGPDGEVTESKNDDIGFEDDDSSAPQTGSNSSPMASFGVKLSEFSSQMLDRSENLDEASHTLIKGIRDLIDRLDTVRSDLSRKEKHLTVRNSIQSNLATLRTDSQEFKSRLQQISAQLEKLVVINFDNLKAKAAAIIKMKKGKSDGKDTVIVTEEKNEDGEELTEVDKGKDSETKIDQEDHFDYTGLFSKRKDIKSNTDDIKHLQNLAINTYSKSCDKISKIHNNISSLLNKVEKARDLFNSFQLSISKSGDSPIPVAISSSHADTSSNLVTTMSISIKPTSLDGTVFYVEGNQSASYGLDLDDGELTASLYDTEYDKVGSVTLDSELKENKWYTIRIIRAGKVLKISMNGEEAEQDQNTETIDGILPLQPSFVKSFIGGVPDDEKITGHPWKGCVGQFVVNGKSLSRFQSDLNGEGVSLCSDHCSTSDKNMFWSFDGEGFVHYIRPPQENIDDISILFRTLQSSASILSVVNRRRQFNLIVGLENGAIKIETSNRVENAVLLSKNSSLNDGELHTLKIQYIQGKSHPELDGEKSAFSAQRGGPKLYSSFMKNGILLGSFISENREYLHDRYRPLIGCIGKLVINENTTFATDASEVYHAEFGHCNKHSVWQSCIHFTEKSAPLSLGSVEKSNTISILVERNATGPLLLYSKEKIFDLRINMTENSVNIIGKGTETAILKNEDENSDSDEFFVIFTLEDTGKKVIVEVYGQRMEISYSSWLSFFTDTTLPHNITLGPRENKEDTFIGSISHLIVGERLYDLTTYQVPNQLESCKQILKPIMQNVIQKKMSFCS